MDDHARSVRGRRALGAGEDVARRRGERIALAFALFEWADLAHAEGDPERSARLFGAAQRALAEIPHMMVPSTAARYEQIKYELRGTLGDAVFEGLHAQGATLSVEEAVELARATATE